MLTCRRDAINRRLYLLVKCISPSRYDRTPLKNDLSPKKYSPSQKKTTSPPLEC
ncbi:unknown protein [Desulfotalea psychrophila LSv54]|uniref:Uncharacterized protein n=1 Tax=Desulfotalea psychrophila (strain LSv54 / DSM 12343) TaxID=177439 RepID=Q6ANR7_DESPS|nr:unknown protein [Desulfotalea psychrophila LSv54]